MCARNGFELLKNLEHAPEVPSQVAVDHARGIAEPADLLEQELAIGETGQEHAAAAGTEIDGEV